jgi:hypothetical protein
VIGPRLADWLGGPLLDREIPEAIAKRRGLSRDPVAVVDEALRSGGERLISRLRRASAFSGAVAGAVKHLDLQDRPLRGPVEEFLVRASVSRRVALGRGGMRDPRPAPPPE